MKCWIWCSRYATLLYLSSQQQSWPFRNCRHSCLEWIHSRVVFSARRTSIPLLSSSKLPPSFQLWMTYEKHYYADSYYFAWVTSQSAGTSSHDSGGGEFIIGTFMKWHIHRANQRWYMDGLRLTIGQRLGWLRIHSEILLLWQHLHMNWRWWSDAVMPRDYQLGGGFWQRHIHSDALLWW